MHQLPRLNTLNLEYILQGKLRKPMILNKEHSFCDDCKFREPNINYSIKAEHYHMYFSSSDYNEPDVVVVIGNSDMTSSEEDSIHWEISYRNMTALKRTILVLMDSSEELVKKGVEAVNKARPVEQLVAGSYQEEGSDAINDKLYFSCLRRK